MGNDGHYLNILFELLTIIVCNLFTVLRSVSESKAGRFHAKCD